MSVQDEDERRRRVAIAAIVATVVLFVVMLGALALGNAVLAGLCFLALVLGWFAVRSFTKRGRA